MNDGQPFPLATLHPRPPPTAPPAAPDVAARWPCCGLVCDPLAALVLLSAGHRWPPAATVPTAPRPPPSSRSQMVLVLTHCVFLASHQRQQHHLPASVSAFYSFSACRRFSLCLPLTHTHTHTLLTHIIVSRHPIRLIAGPSPLFVCAG